jgi:hypothetical protein
VEYSQPKSSTFYLFFLLKKTFGSLFAVKCAASSCWIKNQSNCKAKKAGPPLGGEEHPGLRNVGALKKLEGFLDPLAALQNTGEARTGRVLGSVEFATSTLCT